MMPPVIIDISGLVQQFSFSENEAKGFSKMILDRTAARYMYLWENQVNNGLKSTRGFYKAGMSFKYIDDKTIQFELEGKGISKLGLMLEQGASAFDIKEGLLNSPKAKTGKDGNRYITVPFRIATSSAIAESAVFAGIMPKLIYQIAKQKGSVSGSDLPEEYKVKGVRAELSGTNLPVFKTDEYVHKNPIYEGVTKNSGGGYGTMRRVSDNSEKNSWIHKGFTKRGFMEKALGELSTELPNILASVRKEYLDVKFGG